MHPSSSLCTNLSMYVGRGARSIQHCDGHRMMKSLQWMSLIDCMECWEAKATHDTALMLELRMVTEIMEDGMDVGNKGSIYLGNKGCIYLSITYLSTYLPPSLTFYISYYVCLSFSLSLYLTFHPTIYVYLSIYYLLIYLSIYHLSILVIFTPSPLQYS